MYEWNAMSWGPGGWIVMLVVAVVFWGAVVAGVVALVRVTGRPGCRAPAGGTDEAREILRQRLARGEIGREEYSELLEVLSRNDR